MIILTVNLLNVFVIGLLAIAKKSNHARQCL